MELATTVNAADATNNLHRTSLEMCEPNSNQTSSAPGNMYMHFNGALREVS